jgi:hypothetical protein
MLTFALIGTRVKELVSYRRMEDEVWLVLGLCAVMSIILTATVLRYSALRRKTSCAG